MNSRESSKLLPPSKSAKPKDSARPEASHVRVASDDAVLKAIKRISRENRALIEALAK